MIFFLLFAWSKMELRFVLFTMVIKFRLHKFVCWRKKICFLRSVCVCARIVTWMYVGGNLIYTENGNQTNQWFFDICSFFWFCYIWRTHMVTHVVLFVYVMLLWFVRRQFVGNIMRIHSFSYIYKHVIVSFRWMCVCFSFKLNVVPYQCV